MENLTQGLLLYELILMILGSALFITLLVILVIQVTKDRKIKWLLSFFILPIVMIGFPAIQSVSVADLIEVVMKKSEEVNADPGNVTKAQELTDLLKKVNSKRVENYPEALTALSSAYSALGNYDTAGVIIDKAIELDKSSKTAQNVKDDISKKKEIKSDFDTKINILNRAVAELENNPQENSNQIKAIADGLTSIRPPVYVDDRSIIAVAHALEVVGEKQSSVKMLDKLIEAKPESTEAIKLKNRIEQDTVSNVSIHPSVLQRLQESQIVTSKNTLLLKRVGAKTKGN